METIKVQHGCEHIEKVMTTGDGTPGERFTKAFIDVQNTLFKPVEAQTTKDSKDPSKISISSLRPTYLCIQCSAISSLEDRHSHCTASGHFFAIESRSGCLYCDGCDDFIYDPTFEQVRVQQTSAGNGRKRKLSSIQALGEEEQFVQPNSNALPCQAGTPRGLYNLGQTCYMSVILQAMIHNPFMRNYFLARRHDTAQCTDEKCIACGLTTFFADVLATEKIDGHGPVELLAKSWKNQPLLAGYKQQDAHEYFQSLLDQLHDKSGCTMSKDKKICDCLYHQAFYGKLRSTVTCLKCRNVNFKEDDIVDLSLDLRQQVKRRKIDPKSPSAEEPLELLTCLKNYTSIEKLPPDAYKCASKECGNTPQRAKKQLTIKKLPPTMCIQLKRYEHSSKNAQKLDTKLKYPLQLDMTPYTTRFHNNNQKLQAATAATTSISAATLQLPPPSPTQALASPISPRSPGWFDLSSVVVHIGKIDAGHYICYCKRDDQWFKFDDSKVTLASEKQVLDADPYLLFYIIRNLGGKKGGGETPRKRGETPRKGGEKEKTASEEAKG